MTEYYSQLGLKYRGRTAYKNAILERDNRTCQLCGATEQDGAKLECDHIIPWRISHDSSPDNLRCLCTHCNRYLRPVRSLSWDEWIRAYAATV